MICRLAIKLSELVVSDAQVRYVARCKKTCPWCPTRSDTNLPVQGWRLEISNLGKRGIVLSVK